MSNQIKVVNFNDSFVTSEQPSVASVDVSSATTASSPLLSILSSLLLTASQSNFSTKDFHRVSMREISKSSGLSTTTLYRYYPSKENLLFTVLDEKIGLLADKVRLHIQGLESTREMFRKLFWVTLDHYDKNPGLAVAIFITAPTLSWIGEESYIRKDGGES